VAKDLRIRSIPILGDLTDSEMRQLVAFATEQGAKNVVTAGVGQESEMKRRR
jgi:hypothetical protein